MKCAFGNCGQQHDHWIKPHIDSNVVPICNKCVENENEKYHLSYQDSRPAEQADNYVIAYNPETALAKQLIDISEELENAITHYEGDHQEPLQKAADAREKIEETISEL